MVAVEAMAVGRPVVASRVGGLQEVVEDGRSGLLAPPGEPQAIAQAVNRLLSDQALRQRLAEAGRERVATQFSLDVMAEKTLALYEDLLASRSSMGGRNT